MVCVVITSLQGYIATEATDLDSVIQSWSSLFRGIKIYNFPSIPQGEELIPENAIVWVVSRHPTEDKVEEQLTPEAQATPEPSEPLQEGSEEEERPAAAPLQLGSMADARPKKPKKREVKEGNWTASVQAFSAL